MVLVYIFGYLFIGIIIQLVGKVIVFHLMGLSASKSLQLLDFAFDGEVNQYDDEAADRLVFDAKMTILNVLIWPLNIVFALCAGVMTYIRLKRW